MSDYTKALKVIDNSVKLASRQFHHVIPDNSDIKWGTEKVFALDLMRKNKKIREAIPETQVSALLQAGSMGLTLNPSAGECFLIPRATTKGGSTFIAYASPSYRGLIKTAVDSGAILYGVAEVVHENDKFKYFGKTAPAVHEVDVKKPRGAAIGVYTLARLPSGCEIYSYMDAERIQATRNISDNPNSLMWTTFWQEGWCKAALRTHQKTWPRSKQLNAAIEILNENEGINFDKHSEGSINQSAPIEGTAVVYISVDQATVIRDLITDNFDDPKVKMEIFMNYLSTNHNVNSIDDIPLSKYEKMKEVINESIKHQKGDK